MLGISVKEALDLPQMEGAVLLGGDQGLNHIIHSVNIMEVPDIENYIKPAELLLTTTYPIKDDSNALENLIPQLYKHGLAALAIKPERYIREIPEIMITQANHYGLPLIKLPNTASFNEIINPILTEILNRQAAILSKNEQISKALTEIMLHGGGLAEISRTLAGLLGLPVSIHDPSFRKIASWLSPRDFGSDKNRALSEFVNDSKLLAETFNGNKEQMIFNHTHGFGAICRPVTVAGEIYAYLFIWDPESPFPERQLVGIEQAITAIALEISKRRAIFDVEARFKSSFIDYLMDGKITSREDAIVLAERFGWVIADGFTVILFECDDLKSLYNQDPVITRKKRINMVETINSTVTSLSPGSAVVERGSRLMVLHRSQQCKDIKESRHHSEMLARYCCQELARRLETRVVAGISRFIPDPMEIVKGITQAQQALEIGRCAFEQGQVFHFDDLGVYRILLTSDTAEMRRFYDDVLGRLVVYDQENDAGLIVTLEALFANEMNLQKTAKALFIHYNTIRYRVNRIQQITGLDLKSPDDCLNLQLALKILHMK